MYGPLQRYIDSVAGEFNQIPEDRRRALNKLAWYVQTKVKANSMARLTFICTHNSRRSHLAQIWAQTAAHYYGVPGVETYSGGTEATAFNARAVKAMTKAGFRIEPTGEEKNPVYLVRFNDETAPVKAFSKIYDAVGNPRQDFCAVMTCSQADQNCPFIPGASLRVAIPYNDPKDFDGTPQEEAQYEERTRQIAREILYVFNQVTNGHEKW
ncbi:MAG: protein-tyrosine-phosphatase [Ferruginibacter sp.]|nr:protein-tyrosine-phosphatase [Cytophagales bacterium]